MMPISITSFRPEEAASQDVDDYYQLVIAGTAHDLPDRPTPSRDVVAGRLLGGNGGGQLTEHWLAHDRAGTLVGAIEVMFLDLHYLAHVAFVDVRVHPQHRRQGIANGLLGEAIPSIERRGRTTVKAHGLVEGGPAVAAAQALGFQIVWESVYQLLSLHAVDRDALMIEVPEGCGIEMWTGHTPVHRIESYAQARNAMRDAPTQDPGRVDVAWTPDRVRRMEDGLASRGVDYHVVVAVGGHDDVVGFTSCQINPTWPTRVHQYDTAVVRSHRGRGIAAGVKATMLRWLIEQRPRATEVGTSVARTNLPMLSVNHRLGFHDAYQDLDMAIETRLLRNRLCRAGANDIAAR